MGEFSRLSLFFLPFLVFSMLQRTTLAMKKSYVVYLGSHSHGLGITQASMNLAEQSHHKLLADYVGGLEVARESIIYSYTKYINGFAAILEEETAAEIAKHPEVVSVFPNKGHRLHTTRSWEFMGLEKDGVVPHGSIWEKTRFGEDVIVANLDSGVWPESESFSDHGYGPVPARWKGGCTDIKPEGVRCNRKLIGAKFFGKGYLAIANSTYENSRDDIAGHGTHTLSTAAGNFVHNASVRGFGNGTAKGGSPRARVAAYKVCGPRVEGLEESEQNECFDADIMAAMDSAIQDGVDIISISLGDNVARDYLLDGVAIGSFHAVRNGILVVASAGNNGSISASVTNVAPWIFTVAASTMDRQFWPKVKLGNNKVLHGKTFADSSEPLDGKLHPLVRGSDIRRNGASFKDARVCKSGSLNLKLLKGKILVCIGDYMLLKQIGRETLLAGAVGMIPIDGKQSNMLSKYMSSTKAPKAYMVPSTELGVKPSPVMAPFSSLGPNSLTPEILKPDITAPGVNVIAAFTQAFGGDHFVQLSGTSMSCPHVAGVTGLLKALYPHWSPAAIRSAIMTTASTRDNAMEPIQNASNVKASPFNYGAGHVRPNSAMDPGLVYDLTNVDYLNFLCTIGYNESSIKAFSESKLHYACPKPAVSLLDFNYPTFTVPNLSGSATLTRKVKNVGSSPATYKPVIRPPLGISISVEPKLLSFNSIGQEKAFKLTIKTKWPGAAKDYVFGEFKWDDGRHRVKSRIVVKAATT